MNFARYLGWAHHRRFASDLADSYGFKVITYDLLEWDRDDELGGPFVSGLINAYKAKLDHANTQDRIAADLAAKEIEAEIDARKQASAIILAEQGRWYTAIIRPLLAFPIIIYFWKCLVWDKVLGLGSTDPLTGMVADWTGMIITAYVGGRSIEKVARIFARRS